MQPVGDKKRLLSKHHYHLIDIKYQLSPQVQAFLAAQHNRDQHKIAQWVVEEQYKVLQDSDQNSY